MSAVPIALVSFHSMPLALGLPEGWHPDLLWAVPLLIALGGITWWVRAKLAMNRPNVARLQRLERTAARCRDGGLDVATASHALAQSTRQQAAGLNRASEEMTELARYARETVEAANQAALLTESNRQTTSRAGRELDGVLSIMGNARTTVAQTGEALRGVEEITVQANLLALSVAVQAARCGAGGEGLARMAEELRTLAIRSGDVIRHTGRRVQHCVDQGESAEQTVATLRLTIGEIDAAGGRLNRLTHEIAAAEKEQARELHQLDQILHQSAQALERSATSADANAELSAGISTHAEQLVAAVRRMTGGGASDTASERAAERREKRRQAESVSPVPAAAG